MSRPEKAMRIKLTGADADLFNKAKKEAEKALGLTLTDVDFARSIIKHNIREKALEPHSQT